MKPLITRIVGDRHLIALPIVGVLAVALAAAGLLGWLALREANQHDLERQADVLNRALQAHAEEVAQQITPQIYWDEAVEKARAGDLEWMSDNFGSYIHDLFGYSESYVLDSANRPIFAAVDGEQFSPETYSEVSDVVEPSLTDVRNADIGMEKKFGHMATDKALADGSVVRLVEVAHPALVRGRPAIVAVATIVPQTSSALLEGRPPFLVVLVSPINDAVLSKIARIYDFADLRWEASPDDTRGAVKITTDDGTPVGTLTWRPTLPSAMFIEKLAPALAAAAVILALAGGLALLGGRRVTAALAAAREKSHWDALHDPLTGLPNRRGFVAEIEQAHDTARKNHTPLALLSIDLDRFKELNDCFGHLAGDHALGVAARRIRGAVPGRYVTARIGGDEFQILLAGEGVGEAQAIAAAIIDAMAKPIELSKGVEGQLGASIGIARSDGEDPTELIRHADLALSNAKREGRNRVAVYSAEMDERQAERTTIERELRTALRNGELSVAYQPIVSGKGDDIVGAEALVRWQHPKRGPISPTRFIPVAEQSSLIGEIGDFVLFRACHDAVAWNGVSVSVNLSAAELLNFSVVDSVRSALRTSGLSPERLEIDVGEAAILEDERRAIAKIGALRDLGISVALDNFGAGFSPLACLRRVPFSRLKIDRSIVGEIGTAPGAADTVLALIAIGRSLGMKVTAEGVETDEQQRFLQAAGCETLQGFLFHPPVTAREIARMAAGAAAMRIA